MTWKKWLIVCLAIVLTLSTIVVVVGYEAGASDVGKGVKNVIFFIGDGMGYEVVTTTRILTVGKDGRLCMETSRALAVVSTYSADSLVTDSAAAGTALATGFKTNNGIISMTPPPELKPLKTILEAAKEKKKSTGLVTTVTITHATPACFAAHTDSREELPIADQYAANMNVDILLGGGRQFFIPMSWPGSKRTDERNLIEEFKSANYTYVETAAELEATTAKKILGLFALGPLEYTIDREEKPSEQPTLAEMTQKAIEVLSKNPRGFFLMVEGGKIDWACHGHDPATAVADTAAFNEAVKIGLNFASKVPNTLIIVTADHETGGLGLNIGTEYFLALEVLSGQVASTEFIVTKFGTTDEEIRAAMAEYAGITDLTEEEMSMLRTRKALAVGDVISKRARIGCTTTAHTGADVPLYAFGMGAEYFTGVLDNTYIPRTAAMLAKLPLE